MRKRVIAKGNIHKADRLRVLVTDTLPGDVPIIISNDGFYKNLRHIDTKSKEYAQLVDRITKGGDSYTIPYRYNILRPGGMPRRLSLVHPAGQIALSNFYHEYGDLICYLCRKSDASIRFPEKIASLFFVRGVASEKNVLKGATIDTVDIENTVSNPASYFAYGGVDRAFKFFNSIEYIKLEKRYGVMHYADISKCFSSLYTHTLYWAVCDVKTAKKNTRAANFSNHFDRLMQSVNFNETNGICVGSEFSRIFAELILCEVDRRVVDMLSQRPSTDRKLFGVDFEFKRYVDDYYIFSDNAETAGAVLSAIRSCLADFNLHLNDQKTVEVKRPFITKKSRMIRDSNAAITAFSDRFIEISTNAEGAKFSRPLRVRNNVLLLRSFIESIKSSCFDNDAGYNATSNYIISGLAARISSLVAGHKHDSGEDMEDRYLKSIGLLLEASYFFFSVDPSVPSSLRIAQAAVQAFNFFKQTYPERSQYIADQIVQWTYQFVSSVSKLKAYKHNDCLPLEAINALLVLGEVGREEVLMKKAIQDFGGDASSLTYFEIVSYLYCVGSNKDFDELRERLLDRIEVIISGKGDILSEAQAAHLLLDALSCPYLDKNRRGKFVQRAFSDVGLGQISNLQSAKLVDEFEKNPWFVDWQGIDLLRMIRKKELSAVY